MEDYQIVIASRHRAEAAKNALSLLPTAIIYVDEREADDYKAMIPAKSLRFHRPTTSYAEVRNELIKDFDAPCLVHSNDDLIGLRMARTFYSKLLTDPKMLLAVIENGVQAACDLDIGIAGWSRAANPMLYRPFDPMSLCAPIFAVTVQRGPARMRRFDESLAGRADIEFVLRALLHDRIVWQDRRFYFDMGAVFSGAGGNVDIVGEEQYAKSTEAIMKKWYRYVELRTGSMGRGVNAVRANKQGVTLRKFLRRSYIARGAKER